MDFVFALMLFVLLLLEALKNKDTDGSQSANIPTAYAKRGSYWGMKGVLTFVGQRLKSRGEAWLLLWGAVQTIESDDQVIKALDESIPNDLDQILNDNKWPWNDSERNKAGLEVLGNKMRACFLIGKMYQWRFGIACQGDEFDSNKTAALLFFSKVREAKAWDGADDQYAKEVVKIYEEIMYANYEAPESIIGQRQKGARSQSTSYQGAA
jgi:hypothetical protein